MENSQVKQVLKSLRDLQAKTGIDINRLRSSVALERLLARVVLNKELSTHVIFKGGYVMARVYGSDRYTRDIDATAQNISMDNIRTRVLSALETDIGDGFWFGDMAVSDLEHHAESYGGLRFDVAFRIGKPDLRKIGKLSRVHFDVGVGDSIGNPPAFAALQPLLGGGQSLSWMVYPPEFIYSEKLETLVTRGSTNSRAKDFYDLDILFDKISLEKLASAIRLTFDNRSTQIPVSFKEYIQGLDCSYIEPSWKAQGFGDFGLALDRLSESLGKIDSVL